jgi:hypothetical protein
MKMNATAQLYFKTAIALLVVGMVAGITMSIMNDHRQAGAHAHLNLIGFVLMSVYGTYFALNETKATGRLPQVIWAVHTIGAVVMFISLWMMLSGNAAIEPLVALSSFTVLGAAILFGYVVWKPEPSARKVTRATA